MVVAQTFLCTYRRLQQPAPSHSVKDNAFPSMLLRIVERPWRPTSSLRVRHRHRNRAVASAVVKTAAGLVVVRTEAVSVVAKIAAVSAEVTATVRPVSMMAVAVHSVVPAAGLVQVREQDRARTPAFLTL